MPLSAAAIAKLEEKRDLIEKTFESGQISVQDVQLYYSIEGALGNLASGGTTTGGSSSLSVADITSAIDASQPKSVVETINADTAQLNLNTDGVEDALGSATSAEGALDVIGQLILSNKKLQDIVSKPDPTTTDVSALATELTLGGVGSAIANQGPNIKASEIDTMLQTLETAVGSSSDAAGALTLLGLLREIAGKSQSFQLADGGVTTSTLRITQAVNSPLLLALGLQTDTTVPADANAGGLTLQQALRGLLQEVQRPRAIEVAPVTISSAADTPPIVDLTSLKTSGDFVITYEVSGLAAGQIIEVQEEFQSTANGEWFPLSENDGRVLFDGDDNGNGKDSTFGSRSVRAVRVNPLQVDAGQVIVSIRAGEGSGAN